MSREHVGLVRRSIATKGTSLCALLLAMAAVGCGAGERPPLTGTIPRILGERLDRAEATLRDAHVQYQVVGHPAGIMDASHWKVCGTNPEPGALSTSVDLSVAQSGEC